MIQEEVVTYEVAKLASEAGFKSFTRSYYMIGDKEPFFVGEANNWNVHYDSYSAPTQSLLQAWLREKKGIDIAIVPLYNVGYSYIVYNIHCRDDRVVNTNAGYSTYELALEDALKCALENCVEI